MSSTSVSYKLSDKKKLDMMNHWTGLNGHKKPQKKPRTGWLCVRLCI